MTARILEAVPNFSEGRDAATIAALARAMAAPGVEILDTSSDPDHHRTVITVVGAPDAVEEAAFAAARVATERIDLRTHRGVHPRIGALDVLPFVPLLGLSLEDARASARRVGRRLADELGVPVFFYGQASEPPGRPLAELRRGGFEALAGGWPADRVPDLAGADRRAGPHPTAGATCVGARPLLLAWNVVVGGIGAPDAARIARSLRAAQGGITGVRALALELPARGVLQVSMNLEDVERADPMEVFRAIEAQLDACGGHVLETEIIGMIPDSLLLAAASDRLRLADARPQRSLSHRLVRHLAARDGSTRPRPE